MSIKIGIQLHPQHCSWHEFHQAVLGCEQLGVDSLWTWDHFYPLYGEEGAPMADAPLTTSPRKGAHFEAWTLLTAMACHTSKAQLGLLVGCNSWLPTWPAPSTISAAAGSSWGWVRAGSSATTASMGSSLAPLAGA